MDPELLDELIRRAVLETLTAQQDVTRVPDPTQEQPQMGEAENFLLNLLEGADPTMGVASGMAGLRPDDPNLQLQLLIGLMTGGGIKNLVAAGGRGAMRAGRAIVSGADEAMELLTERLSRGRTGGMLQRFESSLSGRTVGEMGEIQELNRRGRAFKVADDAREAELRVIQEGQGQMQGIRERIFKDLTRKDPLGDVAAAHEGLMDQLEELARRRGRN